MLLLIMPVMVCGLHTALASTVQPATAIRTFLEGLDAGHPAGVHGQNLGAADHLSHFYRRRQHKPVWTNGGPLESQISGMIDAIRDSATHGFSTERYHLETLAALQAGPDGESGYALELLLTDAFLNQARHRAQGAVHPPNLDAEWQLPQVEVDAIAFLEAVIQEGKKVRSSLDSLWPLDDEYGRLLDRRAEMLAAGQEEMVRVPSGPLLKPGQSSERVVILKERLMGSGEHTPLYDDHLRGEVLAFQRAAGLEPDGIVGENTLEVLNASRSSWIDRIDANLERWRWLPRETPEAYIRVNIAAFALRGIENGEAVISMDVIVGQPYRRTPVFTETIKYLVINPYWNVPYSIATKDKLPLLKTDVATLALNGYEARPAGSDAFVSVDAIDWSGVTAGNFNYLLRQRPGAANALGQLKFMLPNPYAVYLHDTPTRELFSRQERAFSSGCIRLQQPRELARWLLARENNPDSNRIDALLDSGETTTIYLDQPMPTYIVYFTAFAIDKGTVTFRRDIYGRDKVIVDALRQSS